MFLFFRKGFWMFGTINRINPSTGHNNRRLYSSKGWSPLASEIAQGPQRYRRFVTTRWNPVGVEPKIPLKQNALTRKSCFFLKRGGKKRSLNSHDKDGCNLSTSSTYTDVPFFVATRISGKNVILWRSRYDFKFLPFRESYDRQKDSLKVELSLIHAACNCLYSAFADRVALFASCLFYVFNDLLLQRTLLVTSLFLFLVFSFKWWFIILLEQVPPKIGRRLAIKAETWKPCHPLFRMCRCRHPL